MVGGNELTSSEVYDWAYSRRRSHLSEAARWSVHRILHQLADPVGRASTIGRPWIWRLRNSQLPADTHQAADIAKGKQDAE
jgi:hypothetical protein